MATWGGQHVGAGKILRIRSGVRICLGIGFVYSVVCVVLFWLWGETLSALFVDIGETAVLRDARRMLLANSVCYPLLTLVNVVRFMIQGMGFGRLAMIAGLMEMVARTAVGFALVPAIGFLGACFASPAAWIMADLFLIPAYFRCYRTLEKILPPAAA